MSFTKKYSAHLAMAVCGLLTSLGSVAFAQEESEEKNAGPAFTIGSKAPAVEIEHWVSDGDGRFEQVTELKSDKIYIIEFWATWCGPCISSMPHLSEVQDKYADQGVQLISVSDEDLETVQKFLARTVRGEDEMTYAELTKNYCLTTDPDRSVFKDYFQAAGQRGIPCAFIVGKGGFVEWIGHPMRMDEPLEQVVNGTWDRVAYAEVAKKEKEAEALAQKAQSALNDEMEAIQALLEEGNPEEAIKKVDELMEQKEFAQFKPMLGNIRSQLLIMFVGGDEGAKALRALAKENKSNADMLNQIAWSLYEKHAGGEELDKVMIDAASEVAQMAADADPKSGAIIDTLAHFVHLQGDLDRAIELQTKAVELAEEEMKDDMEKFLEELKAEKKNK